MKTIFTLLLVLFSKEIYTYGSGSPVCAIEAVSLSYSMGGSSQNLGYSMSVDDDSITITGSGTFKGLLLWITLENSQNKVELTVPSVYQEVSGCDNNVFSLTHKSPTSKSFPITFDATSALYGRSSKLTVNAVIVKGGASVWQMFDPIVIEATPVNGNSTTLSATQQPTSTTSATTNDHTTLVAISNTISKSTVQNTPTTGAQSDASETRGSLWAILLTSVLLL